MGGGGGGRGGVQWLKVLPEREFEVELESGHSWRPLSFLVVEGNPELNQLQEVDVGL